MGQERAVEKKEYKKLWMRRYRAKQHREVLIKRGKCPDCGILLEYMEDVNHFDCPYYIKVHAFLDKNEER